VEKIAFLITDGEQNPTEDKKTKEVFDPVVSSEKLYARGNIFRGQIFKIWYVIKLFSLKLIFYI